jgi:hypothetical protein
MTFEHASRLANYDAESDVKDVVITVRVAPSDVAPPSPRVADGPRRWPAQVPSYFTQKQRQALIDAAEIVNLNVLALIEDNTAGV